MRYFRSFSLICMLAFSSLSTKPSALAQEEVLIETSSFSPAHRQFYDAHSRFKEKSLKNRRFKHHDIVPLVEKLRGNSLFEVKKAGLSTQGRDIYLVKVGTGKTKVLLWSQMHGDEPTATMAIMDMFNFFGQKGEMDGLRRQLLDNLTLYFIPMLNPDGAEVYERRTALGVDMNREARSLQAPEAQLLKNLRDEIKPAFGFNLHDQNTRYTAGRSAKPATISFLAPAYNYEKDVNEVRGRAMQLIVGLNRVLQEYIPGQVAKYSDNHEPRGFGDNIQKAGTSVVLVESGGYKDDPEKQYIRQINFTLIMSALQAISQKAYEKEKQDQYYDIPENGRFLFDLLIRQAQVQKVGQWRTTDIGFDHDEVNFKQADGFYYRSQIEDLGDLGHFYGYQELDATGMQLVPGKTYPTVLKSIEEVKKLDFKQLFRQGYTSVRMEKYSPKERYTNLPIRILTGQKQRTNEIILSTNADFVLQLNGQTRYAVINGFVYDLVKNINGIKNGLVE
ncbi:MAG: M14 family zinc carboxypeptidase [Bacteroidota bacterium]